MDHIVAEVDFDSNGRINYSEFLAATIDVGKLLSEKKVRAIFDQFDVDGNGELTPEEIKAAFCKMDKTINSDELDEIIK